MQCVFSFIGNGKGFGVEPLPIAQRARAPNVIHKIHIETDLSHPTAFCAGSFLDIKTKTAGFKSCSLAFGEFCKKVSDIIKDLDVGARVGAGGPPNGGLVDGNDFIEMLNAVNGLVFSYRIFCAVELIGKGGVKGICN